MHDIRGSSLIESLVALAIFAIGSASTATSIVHSMAIDSRASRLMAATTIAISLEERMRANRDGVVSGRYAWQGPLRPRTDIPATSLRASECDIACDSSGLAAHDLHAFRRALSVEMGDAAAGSVVCHTAATCVIRIAWAGRDVLAWPFCL